MRVLLSDSELTTAVGVTTCYYVVLVILWACDMKGISLNGRLVSISHKTDRVISPKMKLDHANSNQITIIAWKATMLLSTRKRIFDVTKAGDPSAKYHIFALTLEQTTSQSSPSAYKHGIHSWTNHRVL